MKFLSIILILFNINIFADGQIPPPERQEIKISFTYKGKAYKDYPCKVLCLGPSDKLVTIIDSKGKAFIAEIDRGSVAIAKKSIQFYEQSVKVIEAENKVIKVRKAIDVKAGPYSAIGLSFEGCLRQFGKPRGKIQSLKEHVEKGYKALNFLYRGWEVELSFINNRCEWARFNKESSHPDPHRRVKLEDTKILLPANMKGEYFGPKTEADFGDGKKSKQWINRTNTVTAIYSLGFLCDPFILFETKVWEQKKNEINILRREIRKKELNEKFKMTEAAAKRGDLEQQYKLALLYYAGSGVTRNNQLGSNWLKNAAEKGNLNAQYKMGYNHINGRYGFVKDQALAIKWLTLAANKGHRSAQSYLKRLKGQ